eukprot:TRINITY_DN2367_c0_g2_i1.p1 TRINITY_DN2367_c0_g2~~TRINITY_DN2367_c0_g2_i1.p1  ORF type:complete len:343 (-),score=72.86 TRINITY_DN2367_c0_g2_i1:13-1041(-)
MLPSVLKIQRIIKQLIPRLSGKYVKMQGQVGFGQGFSWSQLKKDEVIEYAKYVGKMVISSPRFQSGVVIVAILSSIYLFSWIIHFVLLTKTGIDEDSMNNNYRSQLEGSGIALPDGESPQGILPSIVQLHSKMLAINAASSFDHYYGSPWYEWLIPIKGVGYYTASGFPDGKTCHIGLVPNPPIYFMVLASVLYSFVALVIFVYIERPLTHDEIKFSRTSGLLLFAYAINLMPYMWITRTCFLYHYFPALFFGMMLVPVVLGDILRRSGAMIRRVIGPMCSSASRRTRSAIERLMCDEALVVFGVVGVFLVVFGFYLYYIPYSYCIPLTVEQHNARRWFERW